MSGLVERVREQVRSRSRSRDPAGNDDRSTRDELNYKHQDSRASQLQANDTKPARMSSPTIPAWHIHKGANPKSTNELLDAPFPQPPSMADSRNVDYTTSRPMSGEQTLPHDHRYNRDPASINVGQGRVADYTEEIPVRSSSLQYQQPHAVTTDTAQQLDHRTSETLGQGPLPYPYTVPRRKESLSQNRSLPTNSHERKRSVQQQNEMQTRSAAGYDRQENTNLPLHISNTNLGTEVDQALASLSIGNDNHHTGSRPDQAGYRSDRQTTGQPEHLRLPDGFNLKHKETTTIDTEWKPAVTHETIHPHRTEIVHEAITRDIHIHHYYTYVQPISVVEVLPAKHYRVDERTGAKYEIPEPAGWRMPRHLQPHSPDMASVKGWERHYLVNEQYPRGIPEAPPTTKRRDYSSKEYVNGRGAARA